MFPETDGKGEVIQALCQYISSTHEDYIPCQIEQGLFLGSYYTSSNKDGLKRLNITHVLTVADLLPPHHPNDFQYKFIKIFDNPSSNLKEHFDECIDFIDVGKKNGGVLVHCMAGISRSVTVVVAYLMKSHQMDLSQALKLVRSKRPLARPNDGFISQLHAYQKSLEAAKTVNVSKIKENDSGFVSGTKYLS